jgi:hypothetical protein
MFDPTIQKQKKEQNKQKPEKHILVFSPKYRHSDSAGKKVDRVPSLNQSRWGTHLQRRIC